MGVLFFFTLFITFPFFPFRLLSFFCKVHRWSLWDFCFFVFFPSADGRWTDGWGKEGRKGIA